MSDKKYTITRSFARKITDGNYGSLDFFSSHSEEIDADTDRDMVDQISNDLYSKAYHDVQDALGLEKNTFDVDKVERIIKGLNEREPISTEDFESLTPDEAKIVKQADNAFKRSESYKEALKTRKVCKGCGEPLTVRENMTSDICTECIKAKGLKKY